MKTIKFRYLSLFLVITILGLVFYWYGYRPSKIKQDCSWVKVVEKAIPEKFAITSEDVEDSLIKYDECIERNGGKIGLEDALDSYIETGTWDELNKAAAINLCEQLIKVEREAIPAIPEREWYREAEKDEYIFCLHSNGL